MLRAEVVAPVRVSLEDDVAQGDLFLEQVAGGNVSQALAKTLLALRIFVFEVSQVVSTVVQRVLSAVSNIILLQHTLIHPYTHTTRSSRIIKQDHKLSKIDRGHHLTK